MKNVFKPLFVTAIAATMALATPFATTAVADHHGSYGEKKATKTIVEIAAGNPDFSTLVTAVTEAGLVETLSSEGPFTVFAPTNEAFAAIPEADLKALLADKAALTKVLTYHVVAGKVKAADVVKLDKAKTVQGSEVKIKTWDGKVKVDGANVVKTDIMASNGVIHVIDKVIMPGAYTEKDKSYEKMPSIAKTAAAAGSFNTLLAALTAADLAETMDKGEGPFTVFAPTDEAFAKIPEADLNALLADKDALKNVLLYHVVSGKVMAEDVVTLSSASTMSGQDVKISTNYGKVKVNNANVVKTDIKAGNGVIHVIDTVLLP